MKRSVWIVFFACLMLCGCGSWMDGSYLSVTPYQKQSVDTVSGDYTASNYLELRSILAGMVDSGTQNAVIDVSKYDQSILQAGVDMAIRYASEFYPLGAYSVDKIKCEIGTGGGKPAMLVEISYLHGRAEINKIKSVENMAESNEAIFRALEECQSSAVLMVKEFERTDLVQLVEDYAEEHPDVVMEIPQVFVGVYPDGGTSRIIELKFSYQTSREALRQMQAQVRPVFDAAKLYVSGDGAAGQKYAQLCAFLMERFDYRVETSITPSYSLLRHGVGDSKAFASVYAAMCRRAGLDCMVITGTREGAPWYWNMIRVDENYYHVDLLYSSKVGYFCKMRDSDMTGYVWDYTSYPQCNSPISDVTPEQTEPEEEEQIEKENPVTEPEKYF